MRVYYLIGELSHHLKVLVHYLIVLYIYRKYFFLDNDFKKQTLYLIV